MVSPTKIEQLKSEPINNLLNCERLKLQLIYRKVAGLAEAEAFLVKIPSTSLRKTNTLKNVQIILHKRLNR